MNNDNYRNAAQTLDAADAVLIAAGAGIGVDSGLPDFRGNQGFWEAYPPIAKLGISFYEMANPQWFDHNPKLAWAFYGHRLNLYRSTLPHAGFKQILDYVTRTMKTYFIFTSNVDGQFQKAGYSDENIEECHGSIHHFQCSRPCCNKIWVADDIEVTVSEDIFEAQEPLPVCPVCSAVARPNILMFGDWGWISDRSRSQNNRLEEWLEQSRNQNLVILEIGAGQAVATVRHFSERIASQDSAVLIRINPRDYNVPPNHISIQNGALSGIKGIFQYIKS